MPRAPLRFVLRAVFLIFAALHSWHWRFALDADGISYADLAHAWMRGDWHTALSTYWSPLYPWLLAAVWGTLRPGIYWQLPAVHLVNFIGVLAALAAWEWLVHEWERWQGPPAHPAAMEIAGYGVLFWAAIHSQVDVFPSADMLLIPVLLSVAALTVRLNAGSLRAGDAAWLGVLLGLAFLAKSAFAGAIPPALLAVWQARRFRWIVIPMLATALPFVAALSMSSGRLVISDSGRTNYSWQVSGFGIEGYKESAYPAPADVPHPVRVAFDNPTVLSYDQHVVGTVPSHFDPAWWSAGLPVRVDMARQLMILGKSLAWFTIRFLHCPALIPLLLVILAGRGLDAAKVFGGIWFLWLPVVGFSLAYCLVFVLDRYFAAPWAVLGFAILASVWKIRLPWPQWGSTALVAAGCLAGLRSDAGIVTSAWQEPIPDSGTPVVAAWLRDHGFKPGDRVAVIGVSLDAPWLELAGGQVLVTVPARIRHDDQKLGRDLTVTLEEPLRYWRSSLETQTAVTDLMRGLGAKWLIGWPVPVAADTTGWEYAGDLGHLQNAALHPGVYVRRLAP